MEKSLQELLTSVIDGEVKKVSIPMAPVQDIEQILDSYGVWIEDKDIETNGWEIDFWITYKEGYLLSGSVFSGNYSFEKLSF